MHDLTTQPSDLHATDACLTSHVLDASFGRPASGMNLLFFRMQGDTLEMLGEFATTEDGRLSGPLLTCGDAVPGRYRIDFQTGNSFLGDLPVVFDIEDTSAHHHVPLVLSEFGFSTYRGAPPHRAAVGTAPSMGLPANMPSGQAPPPGSVGAGVTVHIIDISRGIGAGGLTVELLGPAGNSISKLTTTEEGRTAEWLAEAGSLVAGVYTLKFDLAAFYLAADLKPFFPMANVSFRVDKPTQHFHIPLLVTPWGYSCYRGS